MKIWEFPYWLRNEMHSRGLEPLTYGSVDRCSIQLSYECRATGCYHVETLLQSRFATEKEGFEPSIRFNTYTPLAGERLQPLGHFSIREVIQLSKTSKAEGVGFEPTKGVNPCRFSRPVPSTTRPPLRTNPWVRLEDGRILTTRCSSTQKRSENEISSLSRPFHRLLHPPQRSRAQT